MMICVASPSPDWQSFFCDFSPPSASTPASPFVTTIPNRREECVQATICNACSPSPVWPS